MVISVSSVLSLPQTYPSVFGQGHVEMFLCDANDLDGGPDSAVTQACFNKYPLDRAEEDDGNNPIDPNNRGRFILDPPCRSSETDQTMVDGAFAGDVATASFRLPEGLTCERCIVQMAYCELIVCCKHGYPLFVAWYMHEMCCLFYYAFILFLLTCVDICFS